MDSVQLFDYFFVLDFEATCIKDMRINPQEIIEFTCSKINAVTFKEEVEPFHRYVKPVFRPKLSPFCIRLTGNYLKSLFKVTLNFCHVKGITQETVAEARIFKDVLSAFSAWTRSHMTPSSVFVTCGEWPLKTMLPGQCQLSRLQVPSFMTRWICLREEFYRLKRKNVKPWEQKRRLTVMKMLEAFELEIQGKENSGKDDVKNMTVLLKRLCHLGQLRISKASAAPVQRQEQELVSSEQVLVRLEIPYMKRTLINKINILYSKTCFATTIFPSNRTMEFSCCFVSGRLVQRMTSPGIQKSLNWPVLL